jgi:hypothetical protein
MKKFGNNDKQYPSEMRTQLWPLCCGAKILSGFKHVGPIKMDELVNKINSICDEYVPDHQVYIGETMQPTLTYLTLNNEQWGSAKIREAVKKAGFRLFATASPRHYTQYFLVRDLSESFKVIDDKAA